MDLSSLARRELLRTSRENYVITPINGSQLKTAIAQGDASVVDLFVRSYINAMQS